MRTRKEYVDGLRALADFVEQHEELPVPSYVLSSIWFHGESARKNLEAVAKAFGTFEKHAGESYFEISKKFGPHILEANTTREAVCVRKVVGTRKVKKIEPAEVEVEEEIVEWKCPSLLVGDDNAEQETGQLSEA